MIDVVTWATMHHFGPALAESHRVRHMAFIERQGWDVPTYGGLEYDQFDTPAAVYLLSRNQQGRVLGVTRLIPTTQNYMLQQIWPDMLGASATTASPVVWEATRFAVDPTLDGHESKKVSGEIILGCLEFGIALGLSSYFVLSPLAILRGVIGTGGAGCRTSKLAPAQTFGTQRVAAARVEVDRESLSIARKRLDVAQPVLNAASLALFEESLASEIAIEKAA